MVEDKLELRSPLIMFQNGYVYYRVWIRIILFCSDNDFALAHMFHLECNSIVCAGAIHYHPVNCYSYAAG